MKNRTFPIVTCVSALSALVSLSASAVAEPSRPVVATQDGPVRGLRTASGGQYLGIPYAAPPVGSLRWQAPQPAARWTQVLDASQPGSACAQNPTLVNAKSTDEDCLYLNVYTPPGPSRCDPSQRRPVIVYIHGGGLQNGQGSDLDPAPLASQGAVVVTFNYRLGVLGFLAHPELTSESPSHASGNYGLMDQQQALRWVQRNVASFGGDPSNVTIMGESAGGLSVHVHLVAPDSWGLFSRAVVMSGAYSLTQRSLATAEAEGLGLQAALGCTDLACLRAASAEELLAVEPTLPLGSTPNVDGKVLTQSIGSALATGSFAPVPVIEGTTHDEGRALVAINFDLASGPLTAEAYPFAVSQLLGIPVELVGPILQVYPLSAYPSPDLAFATLITDAGFACPALAVNNLLQRHVPTWQYEFSDENAPAPPGPISFALGAYHSGELQYLFDLPSPSPVPPLSAEQEQLSAAMVGYFTKFSRSGDPNDGALPYWAPLQAAIDPNIQQFAPPSPYSSSTSSFAVDHKCAFWAAVSGS